MSYIRSCNNTRNIWPLERREKERSERLTGSKTLGLSCPPITIIHQLAFRILTFTRITRRTHPCPRAPAHAWAGQMHKHISAPRRNSVTRAACAGNRARASRHKGCAGVAAWWIRMEVIPMEIIPLQPNSARPRPVHPHRLVNAANGI